MCEVLEILAECGANPPGVKEIYWAEVNTIDTIAPVNLTTLTISTDITMVGGAKFQKVEMIQEETMFEEEQLGPTDSLHFSHTLIGRIKGQKAGIDAALSAAAGAKVVVIVRMADGELRLIGNKANYAEITSQKASSGKVGSTDRKGTEITIKSVGHAFKAPYYTGAIPL